LNSEPIKLARFSKIEGSTNDKIDLSGLNTTSPQFLNIGFKHVNFDGSVLRRAIFTESKIEDTSFRNSSLQFARLDSAVIASSDFVDANLSRAIFDRTQFSGKVDFSGADLESASFAYVVTDGSFDFTNSAWWLASGWNLDQVHALIGKYPPKDFQVPTKKQAEYENNIAKAPEASFARAEALNDFSWMLATRGARLKDALGYAREALAIMDNLESNRDRSADQRISANYKDTLGYILLQLNAEQRAPEAIQEAAKVLQQSANGNQGADVNFKLAVALFALGNEDESLKKLNLAMEDVQYRPSHELCLLNGYIERRFLERLRQLLKKDK
jgi:tetratricopeptide (TPR) repeat protein